MPGEKISLSFGSPKVRSVYDVRDYLERIEEALLIVEPLTWFDSSFLQSVKEQIEEKGTMTQQQAKSVDNIFSMLEEKGYY